MLNISQTLHTVMHSLHLPRCTCNVFTDQFPLAKSCPTEIMSKANDLNLSNSSDRLAIENLNEQCIASVAGTYNGKLVIEVNSINAPSETKCALLVMSTCLPRCTCNVYQSLIYLSARVHHHPIARNHLRPAHVRLSLHLRSDRAGHLPR